MMDSDANIHPERTMSKVVGLYQTLLRRALEHFFPDSTLDLGGDRSFILVDDEPGQGHFRFADDPDGIGVEIEWLRTRYFLLPGSPNPFLPSERSLLKSIVRLLDLRFRSLTEPVGVDQFDLFHFAVEDMILADYLGCREPTRLASALEAMRVAALSTYENRRVSSGVLLMGTHGDPAFPGWINYDGAPRFNARLTAIKGFHRLCDGVNTVFLVDLQGELERTIDVRRWADRAFGAAELPAPCPRAYQAHAKATLAGGNLCVVLTPSQEIKVFSSGTLAFSFSDARWRLMDLPARFGAWCEAVGNSTPKDLASIIFHAALNLAEARTGAMFVVLRDPARSVPELIAPSDRILEDRIADDPADPDNLSPRLAKQVLHHVVRGQTIAEVDPTVLECIASIDGAVVVDTEGHLITFGAILRMSPETLKIARAVEGARTLASLGTSFHGPVLKVSEDGFISMYLGGRRIWEM
ncbi:diadenylate cyclase [Isosphaeraceae bacterium EP7]